MEAVCEVEGLRCLGDAGLELRAAQAIEGAAATEVLEDGQLAVEAGGLEDDTQSRANFGCCGDDIMACDGGCSRIG